MIQEFLTNVELGTTMGHLRQLSLYSTDMQLYTDGWLAYRRLPTLGYHHRYA